MLDVSDRDVPAVGVPLRPARSSRRESRSGHTGTGQKPASSTTRFPAMFSAFLVLPAVVAISVLVARAYTPRAAAKYSPVVASSGVDCIGDGASCVGFIDGSRGEVSVTNNRDPRYHWRFKLTCGFGGDQISALYDASPGTVTSQLTCNFNAPATYWNVIVDYRP
ncbi:MAG TPA: hypothetical protein VFO16_14640 [Pseudonocardiaceae bacterium]|nr:hypothetical protein [Pseudonocardiaceae bacterium]